MTAPQYPDELRLAHTQRQQGNTKLRQNILELSKPEAQPSIVRAGFHYCGQQKEYSNQNLCNFGPYMNIDTGLQQGRYLYCAHPADTGTAAFQRGSLGSAALTFALQDQCCSVYKNKQKTSSLLLQTLLEGKLLDCKSMITTPISSQAALHFGRTRMQNINPSGGTHPSPYQQHVSSISLSSPPSTEEVSPDGEIPWTLEQIYDYMRERVAFYKENPSQGNRNYGHTSSNIDANIPTLEESGSNGSKAAEPTPESKGDECAASASEKHSTECPQIMMKVAATCTRTEDEIRTTAPGLTLDELTEKQPSSTPNFKPSSEEYKSPRLDINKTVDETDQVPGVSKALEYITERDEVDGGNQTVEKMELDSMHGVADVSEDFQTKSVAEEITFEPVSLIDNLDSNINESETDQQHCRVSNREVISHSKLNSPTDKIQIDDLSVPASQSEWLRNRGSCELLSKDVGSVCSQTDLNIALSKKNRPVSWKAFPTNGLKNPKYEDISEDEEISQVATKPSQPPFPSCFEDIQFENISEDENQTTENMSVERPSLKQVTEINNKLSLCTNGGYGDLHTDSAHSSHPCFDESDHGKDFVSCSSVVLEEEYESDDQIDDDWIVIPIKMSDLRYEPGSEDRDGLEAVELDDGDTEVTEKQCGKSQIHRPRPQQVPPSTSSNMVVFETVDSFEQANAVRIRNRFELASTWSIPDNEMVDEGEPHVPEKRRELYSHPEDSSDTDDSIDYPSVSKNNYLTGLRQSLESPGPLTAAAEVTEPDREGEDEAVTNEQNGPKRSIEATQCRSKEIMQDALLSHSTEKSGQHIETTAQSEPVQHKSNRQKAKKRTIILDSDSEDESDQNCKKKAKRSPESEESGDFTCTDQPQRQCHSKLINVKFKEAIQGPCSDQMIGTKPDSDPVQAKTDRQKLSTTETVIIISDSDNDDDESCKNANGKNEAPCAQQKRHSPESVGPDMSHSENGQQIEAKHSGEDGQHKIHSQTMSAERTGIRNNHLGKRAASTKRILSSESEDCSDDALVVTKKRTLAEPEDHLCSTANKKLKKDKLSSEDLPKAQHQFMDKETDSASGPNVIPRLVNLNSSPKDCLQIKLQTQGNPSANGKKNVQHLNSNEQSRFVSKPKPTNNKVHATKNNVQANLAKPTLVSRQSSLPHQKSPSNSNSSLSFTSGPPTEARQSPTSLSDVSPSGETSPSARSNQSTSIPRQHLASSKLQGPYSCSNSTTSGFSFTSSDRPSSSATLQLTARDKVTEDWKNSRPNMRDGRSSSGMQDTLRTSNNDPLREVRPKTSHSDCSRDAGPGPRHYDLPRGARPGPKPERAPLMKKTMSAYLQMTKAKHLEAPREQRCTVLKGYKWGEKPKPKKGPRREGTLC